MSFIPVIFIATIFAAIAPWRWVWRFCVLTFALGVVLLAALDDASTGRPGAAIDAFMFVLALVPVALVVTMRFAWNVWLTMLRHRGDTSPFSEDQPRIEFLDLILVTIAGMFTGIFGVAILGTGFKSANLSYLGHGLGGLLAIAVFVALTRNWLRANHLTHRRHLAFFLSIAFVVAAISICGTFYPRLVVQEAMAKAGVHPYCIAMNTSRRPVLSVQDMTLFGLDKGGLRHHAILLVDRHGKIEPYHWSFRNSAFQAGVWFWDDDNDARSRIDCQPKKDFAKHLPIMRRPKNGYEWVYLDKRLLEIPTAYDPETSLGDIKISAHPPDFRPASHLQSKDRVLSARRDHIWLEHFADDAMALPPSGRVDDLREVHVAEHDGVLYYRLDDRGSVETFITCHDDRPKEIACWHRFYRDGRLYSFKHGKELIDQSASMKKTLLDLFASFDLRP